MTRKNSSSTALADKPNIQSKLPTCMLRFPYTPQASLANKPISRVIVSTSDTEEFRGTEAIALLSDPSFQYIPELWESKLVNNSTELEEYSVELLKAFQSLFTMADEEIFEDGMETEFSNKLVALIMSYGSVAIDILANLILTEKVNPSIAAEALRWIGRLEYGSSRAKRRRILVNCLLHCKSARVRDGAALGLASLDDPKAIPYLEKAIAREQVNELRQDLEQVLAQLKETYIENT